MAKKKAKKKTSKKASKKTVKKGAKKTTKKATKKMTKKTATKKPAAKKKATKKGAAKKGGSKKTSIKKNIASMKVGEKVSDFHLDSTGSKVFHLNEHQGKVTVLYFYPKDSTPGCTIEGQDFTRLHNEFKQNKAEVYGISRDSMKSHENFKTNQSYTVDLLSDPDEKACQLFGVIKEKNMYGRKVMGIERSTFVIDKEGYLVKEWRGVKVPGHAEEVLEFIKTL